MKHNHTGIRQNFSRRRFCCEIPAGHRSSVVKNSKMDYICWSNIFCHCVTGQDKRADTSRYSSSQEL